MATKTTKKGRWCTAQRRVMIRSLMGAVHGSNSTVPAYVAAIENSLIYHPCHTNITPRAVITSGKMKFKATNWAEYYAGLRQRLAV